MTEPPGAEMSADTPGADPFARNSSRSERTVSISARAAVVWSAAYLIWRGGFTLSGADAPAAVLLFVAEVLALVVFAARVRAARHSPIAVVASPDAPLPDIAAVVDATGTSVDELRTSLVALRRVSGGFVGEVLGLPHARAARANRRIRRRMAGA
jgi:hypothetical protein